jgi:hypothetical protein
MRDRVEQGGQNVRKGVTLGAVFFASLMAGAIPAEASHPRAARASAGEECDLRLLPYGFNQVCVTRDMEGTVTERRTTKVRDLYRRLADGQQHDHLVLVSDRTYEADGDLIGELLERTLARSVILADQAVPIVPPEHSVSYVPNTAHV